MKLDTSENPQSGFGPRFATLIAVLAVASLVIGVLVKLWGVTGH